jgi:4-hydroxy-3-methylbut-2-enyl diphosphate reductase
MEVVAIRPRGFCHGVVEAIRLARQIRESTEGGVHVLGHLVHNTHITEELAETGIAVEDAPDRLQGLERIPGGTVIFTAHGVSPAVRERARARGLRTVDATCSDVTRTHELVRRLAESGHDIVYIGRRGHPEPEGVIGEAPGRVHLVEDESDVDALRLSRPVAVTCQTTLSIWDTSALIDRVLARYPEAEVHNEICGATQDRQEAAVQAAREVDVVIVVGSPRSSNSRRLVEVVRSRAQRPAYLVDDVTDLCPEWFAGVRRVGVTSGASTPSQLTRRVIRALEEMPPVP